MSVNYNNNYASLCLLARHEAASPAGCGRGGGEGTPLPPASQFAPFSRGGITTLGYSERFTERILPFTALASHVFSNFECAA